MIFKKSTYNLILASVFAFLLSLLLLIIFYNLSSNLKFIYLDLKNKYSKDNKYLAMVTDSGLWIKDEVDNNTLIIKSKYIKGKFLSKANVPLAVPSTGP